MAFLLELIQTLLNRNILLHFDPLLDLLAKFFQDVGNFLY